MKSLILMLIVALLVAACGSGEDFQRKYLKMEGYSCAGDCTCPDCKETDEIKGCDFTEAVFHIFRTEDGECSKMAFSEEDVLYGDPKYCTRFDLNVIDIFSADGGSFNCSGSLEDDGVHLKCEAGQFNGDKTCQEVVFKRIYKTPEGGYGQDYAKGLGKVPSNGSEFVDSDGGEEAGEVQRPEGDDQRGEVGLSGGVSEMDSPSDFGEDGTNLRP